MKDVNIKTSYTAADTMPIKVMMDKDLLQSTTEGIILPIHAQFIPTNRCNRNCSFCSCSDRDRNLEMDFITAIGIIDILERLGTKAVTITGGGEPLCYPDITDLINYFSACRMQIGLVTNGILLPETPFDTLRKLTWCRISSGDDREFSQEYSGQLSRVIDNCVGVDWAFSHVVSDKPNIKTITKVIDFANKHSFTHVRLVADLYIPEMVDMEGIRYFVDKYGVDDSRVIYQPRQEYTQGGPCYIGYLKPVIYPDGKVYACCGAQYALGNDFRDMPEELFLGDAKDMEKIIQNSSQPFDGSICKKCYYKNYNDLLASMLGEIKHRVFV